MVSVFLPSGSFTRPRPRFVGVLVPIERRPFTVCNRPRFRSSTFFPSLRVDTSDPVDRCVGVNLVRTSLDVPLLGMDLFFLSPPQERRVWTLPAPPLVLMW